jgi:hypothetical protein
MKNKLSEPLHCVIFSVPMSLGSKFSLQHFNLITFSLPSHISEDLHPYKITGNVKKGKVVPVLN